jgi:SAM-dependent methyltransferase
LVNISPRAALAFELGLAAHGKGDFQTALARFSEAYEAAPDWHEAGFALSHTHERLGRIEQAFAVALRCMRPGPASPAAIKYLSDLLANYPPPPSFMPTRDDLAAILALEDCDLRLPARAALAALKRLPPLSDALQVAKRSGFAAAADWTLSEDGRPLLGDTLLCRALALTPNTDPAIELLLSELHARLRLTPRANDRAIALFADALAAQCALNENLWVDETDAPARDAGRTSFADATSQRVAQQYEEHPYPAWTHVNLPDDGAQLAHIRALQAARGLPQTPDAPRVLVAGCGTGQQVVQIAAGLGPNARLLCCDLSEASLAYARRKAIDYGFADIEFRRADILDLAALNERFDIVSCTGVLHHMRDPVQGWRILTDLTAPGGAQYIALYSAHARTALDDIRRRFPPDESLPMAARIRDFRRRVLDAYAFDWAASGMTWIDFFIMGGCRDLLFHAHEDRYTIPRIAEELRALGLTFLDFVLPSSEARQFGDLADWDRHERAHPDTFTRMYLFWCAKAG